jgi:hypothetical protein
MYPAGYGHAMNTVPTLLTTPLAVRAVEYVRACETEPVANHSLRSYLFAVLLAEHEGLRPAADFELDLLFFACVLHDLGTSPEAGGTSDSRSTALTWPRSSLPTTEPAHAAWTWCGRR